ncbi:Uncharacterized protein dnm_007980 [Desulfonema magnum]|uniref:Uncharacterized protein n=1 Tax=Desulfonema magnum TaxID=45655 RepID=A0A975BGD4_9BACT|nr:Uncharacterized protein dnm_007980 [Desulfonema magnum]
MEKVLQFTVTNHLGCYYTSIILISDTIENFISYIPLCLFQGKCTEFPFLKEEADNE